MSGDWPETHTHTLRTFLVTFFFGIIRCTETFLITLYIYIYTYTDTHIPPAYTSRPSCYLDWTSIRLIYCGTIRTLTTRWRPYALVYANIRTSSEIRGHLKTLCLIYSYMNLNHIYIHILPTPPSQYQEPITVGVIYVYVHNAFSPLLTPVQLL
jgi:hypothetical protein